MDLLRSASSVYSINENPFSRLHAFFVHSSVAKYFILWPWGHACNRDHYDDIDTHDMPVFGFESISVPFWKMSLPITSNFVLYLFYFGTERLTKVNLNALCNLCGRFNWLLRFGFESRFSRWQKKNMKEVRSIRVVRFAVSINTVVSLLIFSTKLAHKHAMSLTECSAYELIHMTTYAKYKSRSVPIWDE